MHSLAEDLTPPQSGFVPADRVARLGTETVFAVSAEAAALAAQGARSTRSTSATSTSRPRSPSSRR